MPNKKLNSAVNSKVVSQSYSLSTLISILNHRNSIHYTILIPSKRSKYASIQMNINLSAAKKCKKKKKKKNTFIGTLHRELQLTRDVIDLQGLFSLVEFYIYAKESIRTQFTLLRGYNAEIVQYLG